jgi:ParB-like chromosome segregation protein Spo0J
VAHEEQALAKEARQNIEELLEIVLRDGSERPVSEILALMEAIAISFTGVAALPAQLEEEPRRKAELASATNRLKQAGALQVQGKGAQRKVKLTNPPDWLERDRQVLDAAEAEASRELLKRLSDGEWHLTDTVLMILQDLRPPEVSEIGKFAVAYAALERVLREGRCIRRTSGRKGTIDYTDEVKLAGPGQAPEANEVALGEGTAQQTEPGGPGSETSSSTVGEDAAATNASASIQQGIPGTGASGGEGTDEPESTSPGMPSHSTDGASTSPQDDQADHETSSAAGSAGGLQDGPAEGDSAPDAGAEQAPDLPLQAGFRPQGGAAEVVYLDSDKIDLDDGGDEPLAEVVGLSQSIGNLGLLGLPGVRPGPVEGRYRVVYGRRRLRECKKKGWQKIPCIVLRVDDRTAELAAIDENLVRSDLTVLERAEHLRRRKQIYEELHPEAAPSKGGRPPENRATVARFPEDAARRTKSSKRKVLLDLDIAEKLTEPAKKVLRPTEFADKTTVLTKLAKLEPGEQLPAAELLAKGQATSVQAATRILEQRRQGQGGTAETAERDASTPAATPEGGTGRPAFEILTGDCLNVLPAQASGRFRLIFADPPQNDGVDYGEGSAADQRPDAEYLAWVGEWLGACVPLLTEDGSLWLLTRDRYVQAVHDLIVQVGLHPRSWIKVYEPPGVGPAPGFLSSTLHLLHSTKSADRFAFHPEGLEQAVACSAAETKALATLGCKLTDDVWVVPRLKATAVERIPSFPAQRRKALLQPIVRCATEVGDWVLDPFAGSATAGVVALEEGRNYLGIEKNAQFAEQSRGRLTATVQAGAQEKGGTGG